MIMQAIYPKFREMDGLIVATPVMTMGIPGKLKSFIDRFQVFFMAKYVRKKPFISKEKKIATKGALYLHFRYEYPRSICRCQIDNCRHFLISSTVNTVMNC